MSAATRRRVLPRIRGRLPRPGPRTLVAVLALAALLVGAFFWVRQSPLVAVQRVTVTGVSGPDAGRIRSSLTEAAEGMSTMHLDNGRLHTAVAPYPIVRSLHASKRLSAWPADLRAGGDPRGGARRRRPAHDCRRRRDAAARHPSRGAVADNRDRGHAGRLAGHRYRGGPRVGLLAAAPYRMLAKVASATEASGQGLAVTLRDGPVIYFGADSQLSTKWRAAAAVLALPSSEGASYIDVTDPDRPAAGTGSDSSPAAAAGGESGNP